MITTGLPSLSCAVYAAHPSYQAIAHALATRLGIPLLENALAAADTTLVLHYDAQGLALYPQAPELGGALRIDFLAGRMGYRVQHGADRHQALARAIGIRGAVRPEVLDATAGLGRDGFILAHLGCAVRWIERSPIVAALLADGLERALADPALSGRLQLRLEAVADASEYLPTLSAEQAPEVVYLDPMYPHRDKSALVKKEMRVLRLLVGEDQDSTALLAAALACARSRVVVKRPKGAPLLVGPKPHHTIEGKNTRYDVYM